MQTTTSPSCATYSQFMAWQEANVFAARTAHCNPAQFCEDCTRSFQKEMVKTGRCDNPDFRIKDES